MTEHPIIFSTPMVQSILRNEKSQTRRIVKGHYLPVVQECLRVNGKWVFSTMEYDLTTPYGEPGDRLWVRETWNLAGDVVRYRADFVDESEEKQPWKPSIHMQRKHSRINLEIANIRVEKLNAISEADCCAEGCGSKFLRDYKRPKFKKLWEEINGDNSWELDPWVWVVEFKRV